LDVCTRPNAPPFIQNMGGDDQHAPYKSGIS